MMTLTGDDSSLKTNQLRALTYALDRAESSKRNELREEFNMNDPARPKTPEEFKTLISEGKFIFSAGGHVMKDNEKFRSQNYSDYLVFHDPAKLPDCEGYSAAYTKLNKVKEDYDVRIGVLQNPEDGLKILEDFKALPMSTFH